MTRNAKGEWRSADFIKIERAKHLIGAHYRAELKRRLETLGYATEQTMVGSVPASKSPATARPPLGPSRPAGRRLWRG